LDLAEDRLDLAVDEERRAADVAGVEGAEVEREDADAVGGEARSSGYMEPRVPRKPWISSTGGWRSSMLEEARGVGCGCRAPGVAGTRARAPRRARSSATPFIFSTTGANRPFTNELRRWVPNDTVGTYMQDGPPTGTDG
jgi:hypothetical protein